MHPARCSFFVSRFETESSSCSDTPCFLCAAFDLKILAWLGGRRRLLKEQKAKRKLAKSFAAVHGQGGMPASPASRSHSPAQAAAPRTKNAWETSTPASGSSTAVSLDILAITLPGMAPPQGNPGLEAGAFKASFVDDGVPHRSTDALSPAGSSRREGPPPGAGAA